MRPDFAQRIAAGATVITPNRRLAAHLRRAFDTLQLESAKTVWPSVDILPYQAFLERTWSEVTRLEGSMLLSPQQETALWERVIEESPQAATLLHPAATARAAGEAWAIRYGYRIDPSRFASILDEDASAFSAWSARYTERCAAAGWIDSARLPDAIAQGLNRAAPVATRSVVRCGFDLLSPQQCALFEALAAAGCGVSDAAPVQCGGLATRQGHADAETEFAAVALQVKALLAAQPDARIGVVVPDLAARRAEVLRIFDDVLEPTRVLSAAHARARPFNVSLGLPLSAYPLVHAAFLILRLARRELPLADAGALLRSPFIGAGEQEFCARALVDGDLRRRGRNRVRISGLLHAARGGNRAGAPHLAVLLEAWSRFAREARKKPLPPSGWSATLLGLLKSLGWPGERTLDSEEFQAFETFRGLVSGLSALDAVMPTLTYDEALDTLKRLASDTLFQPESPEVPVQVLGVLEAAGLEFDALFVSGLSDDAWPGSPRPNPFLPASVQRARGVPHASAEWELQFARRMTQLWSSSAGRVVFTWPQRDGDRELKPSPLISGVPQDEMTRPKPVLWRDTVFAARRIETLSDFAAPPIAPGVRVPGGSQFFKNQAACPFRAFAAHRLGAAALEEGHEALDARERGSLVHHAAAVFWRAVRSQAGLTALNDREVQAAIADAAAAAIGALRRSRPDAMTDAFAALERSRVAALLARLVALERTRTPFEVLTAERLQPIQVAGVELSARFDRVDRVAAGQVILDYKTGRARVGDWLGERPEEPQLPLYAVSARDVCGVSFVQLRAREVAFKGLVRDADTLAPEADGGDWTGVRRADDWQALLEGWRAVLENLAREFLAGRADVAPKKYPDTCKHCDFGLLCRVRELMDRGPVAPEEGNGGE